MERASCEISRRQISNRDSCVLGCIDGSWVHEERSLRLLEYCGRSSNRPPVECMCRHRRRITQQLPLLYTRRSENLLTNLAASHAPCT
ncbi:unnamed protein product [Larinioides sclopetarius]|uniref:Uncharacterized protein n=1 Tax=Larinioides sclopetarius TaxID=280406 RepID=A0AAV2ANX4_9ARAC